MDRLQSHIVQLLFLEYMWILFGLVIMVVLCRGKGKFSELVCNCMGLLLTSDSCYKGKHKGRVRGTVLVSNGVIDFFFYDVS